MVTSKIFCRICGTHIYDIPNAHKLRKLGYCGRCLPNRTLLKTKHCIQPGCNKKLKFDNNVEFCRLHALRCIAITKKGTRCKIPAFYKRYCKLHQASVKDDKSNNDDPLLSRVEVYRRMEKIFYVNRVYRVSSGKDGYHEYLMSKEWRTKSKTIREFFFDKCQLCNANSNIQAHHRSYKCKGVEIPEDLVVLCGDCHSLYHKQLKNRNNQPIA